MPTKTGMNRPRAGHGLTSAITPETITQKPARNRVVSAKAARNRVRVVSKASKRRSR
jgi:hypothetical protein